MLTYDDPRWISFTAGYRIPVDLRPLLERLALGADVTAAWRDLWEELYHQGDVGEGSFAAVPHLVRIHKDRGVADWNTYAIVCTIDLARGINGNPDVPEWLLDAYDDALQELARVALDDFPRAVGSECVRSILALLALARGARTYARLLSEFTEDELLELEEQAFGEAG